MKGIFLNILKAAVIAALFSVKTAVAGQMTIKFQPGSDCRVKIGLVGSGTFSIDWGDGYSEISTYEFDGSCEPDDFTYYGYIYFSTSVRTVTITGQNVTSLDCSAIRLISLDLSSNPALMVLWCANSQLAALDVSRNTALKSLDCSQNRLMTLDVSHNTSIEILNCSQNSLTALNVSRNKSLAELHCSNNRLTALDVTGNKTLTELYCSNNRLTALDVSRNTALKALSYDKDSVKLITR